MPCLYVLFSEKLNKYYVGASTDLDRRLYEHNIGHSKFTRLGIPWKLVYTEYFISLRDAKKRESYIKKMKGQQGPGPPTQSISYIEEVRYKHAMFKNIPAVRY